MLGSGSNGNSAVVDCGGTRLLIDAGLSAKQIQLRLQEMGVDPLSLDGILVTHEHGDHVAGLRVFCKRFPVPIYTTGETSQSLRNDGLDTVSYRIFETARPFQIGHASIESFSVHHDAANPVGFVIEHNTRKLGFVSDVGHVTRSMVDRLKRLHGIFVEANYDDHLLEQDIKRPWSIKQRISSRHGHLSNLQLAELIREIAHPELKRVILGHLSSDCNSPELALGTLNRCLSELGYADVQTHCAEQKKQSPWMEI